MICSVHETQYSNAPVTLTRRELQVEPLHRNRADISNLYDCLAVIQGLDDSGTVVPWYKREKILLKYGAYHRR